MIVSPSDFLDYDKRFRQWGKLVTKTDIDLKQNNGYSLNGSWVKFHESVALEPGKYLIVASETGSRSSHSYSYALIDGANGQKVDKDLRIAALDVALSAGRITEEQRAKAKNSCLYSYGLWISIQ